MGLFGLASKVTTIYKADTTDHIKELKKLKGVQAELHAEELKRAEAQNERLGDQIRKIEKIATGYVAYQVAVGALGKSMDAYGKSSAEAAARVQKIKDSTDRAFSSIFSAVGRVVVELEPLITALADIVGLVGDIVELSGDGVQVEAKGGDGKTYRMAGGIGTLRYERLADQTLGEFFSGVKKQMDAVSSKGDFDARVKKLLDENRKRENNWDDSRVGKLAERISWAIESGFENEKKKEKAAEELRREAEKAKEEATRLRERSAQEAERMREERRRLSDAVARKLTDDLLVRLEREQDAEAASESISRTSAMIRQNAPMGGFDADVDATLKKFYGEGGEFEIRKGQVFLEKMFGPVDEFNVYASAFEMLSGAVTAALEAWIDGSQSAGEAFKSFIGTAIKSLSTVMMTEGIKHSAYVLGSLAIGDAPGAARHAAAAGAFLSGAAWSAVAAKAMGAGGGSGSGATPSAAGGGGGAVSGTAASTGSTSTGPQTNVTIVTGDSFSDDSPRNRRLRAERLWERARGTSGVIHE